MSRPFPRPLYDGPVVEGLGVGVSTFGIFLGLPLPLFEVSVAVALLAVDELPFSCIEARLFSPSCIFTTSVGSEEVGVESFRVETPMTLLEDSAC